MKTKLVSILTLVLAFTGCATTQTGTTSSTQTLINDGWTAANSLQTANNGQLLSPTAVNQVLTLTHNSGDAEYAALATALINQVAGAVVASQAAKVNPIPAVNAVLAPTNVANTATAVANGTPTVTSN